MLVTPVSVTTLTVLAGLVALGVIVFGFWGEYTRKAHIRGYLAPSQGLVKVYAREPGTIVEKHVTEGQHVKKGDSLFVVSMERRSREAVDAQGVAISKLRERHASLQTELTQQDHIAQIETQSLHHRLLAMEAELGQLTHELTTQERRVANVVTMLKRYQDLLAQSFVSEAQVQEKQLEVLDQQGKLQALQRSRISLQREVGALRAEVSSAQLKAKTQRGGIERNISTLEQELTEYESRRTVVVTAPTEGTATALLADQGQSANPSLPLLSIMPTGAVLEAHLLVPSRSIGFLVRNQPVALRYQAFPYQRFGSYKGRITDISQTLILPNETSLPIPLNEPAYRVTVALDSQSIKAYRHDLLLQAGMLLDADIGLDHRKLYEWVLDPLYSVTGKV
jgi:membrane fusion protein